MSANYCESGQVALCLFFLISAKSRSFGGSLVSFNGSVYIAPYPRAQFIWLHRVGATDTFGRGS